MQSFTNVYITARVRASLQKVLHSMQHKRFWELISLLKNGRFEIPGLNVEKLHGSAGSGKIYSARLSRDLRIIFSMRFDRAQAPTLIIQELNHHDAAYERANRLSMKQGLIEISIENENNSPISSEVEFESEDARETQHTTLQLFRVPDYLISDPSRYIQFERSLDRYLLLTDEQEGILSLGDQALLIQGPAGTGKTTLALFQALRLYESQMHDSILLFTYHEELACVCRAYKVNLLGEDDSDDGAEDEQQGGIRVFSYLEFVNIFLSKEIQKLDAKKTWITKQKSIELLQWILSQKSRWLRNFSAEDFYGLIYSILKGRFVPGTDRLPSTKDDYTRIFKDYGRSPEDLDEILEIFAVYQNRLEIHKQLDEADIIRLSYEQLKHKACLNSALQRLWIIIDEVQDFTELEWKSILLFWENQVTRPNAGESYPFVCGDINQNISRSGFRWQELEAYLRSILNNMHRQNALKRITLHNNYRNTQEIHQLATFVRRFGSDTSDLGLPSAISGPKPILSICDEKLMVSALRNVDSNYSALNPLVVLVEDEASLRRLRQKLSNCQNIFLLSLRQSKGMEFEDVLIYRAFSSVQDVNKSTAETSRLFDLWYMGICRARRNLMLVMDKTDLTRWKNLLQDGFDEFNRLVHCVAEENFSLEEFLERRQLNVPDYNVIFLERRIAEDLWQQYVAACQSSLKSDNQDLETLSSSDKKEFLKERSLSLWWRCLDYSSLGRAYMFLKEYAKAIPLLKRSGLFEQAAQCLLLCERYDEAAELYERTGSLREAANAYAQGKVFERAAEIFEKLSDWKLCAENYQKAGKRSKAAQVWEKSGMHEAAAEIYKSKGNHLAAAESFFQAADYQNAAEMFLKADEKLEAARCFEKCGQYERSEDLFLELNQFAEAARSCEANKSFKKAASYYTRAGKLLEAASMHENAHQYREAALLYKQIEEHEKAGSAFEKSQMPFEASIAYEKAGNLEKGLQLARESSNKIVEARCHERLGDFQNAALCYKETNNLSEAAYCLEKSGSLEAAATLYEETENYAQASSCLLRLERKMEAARLLILAAQVPAAFELCLNPQSRTRNNSSFTELIQWCRENKRISAEAQLFELNKDFASAAKKYQECMMLTKAASCSEKSGKLLDAAKLYTEAADFEKASECYQILKKWKEAAQCLERIQRWADAKLLYERCDDKPGIARCTNALNWMP